jgi:alkaline phosphatase D
VDRRTFLTDLSRYAFFCAGVPNAWRVTARPRFTDDPFALGVASGDPTSDSCVIWTRLATDPLAPLGGLNGLRTVIGWEVAHDEAFSRIVRQGRYTCAPELSFSAHVDVEGLEPNRWYFYRFTTNEGSSPVGRLRTTPPPGAVQPLDLAFVSCNHWEQGLFTAYRHLAGEELDLVAHLGDYIYEYAGNTARVRTHASREVVTLDDYRGRYAQYKSDPQLQAAHAGRPWLVTWDDHEVDNNYAGLVGENRFESREQMQQRRAAGYQAWWEHQPVRVPRPDSWADLTIQRSATWGSLARLWVLDTRQYRSDQPCGDGAKPVPCGDWGDPDHTMLGPAQERWLLDGLGGSSARWQVLAQQVMMAPFDRAPDDSVLTSMDQWSGYPAARDRLLRAVAERAPGRTVVLTGDIHSNWVNDLRAGFDRPDSRVVGTELVGTSISSGGDGEDQWAGVAPVLDQNPHVQWQNSRRGYVRCRVTENEWRADYRTVPYVTRPGAPISTASSWRCEHGRPGVERTDGG